jgi:hypothetical protein
MRLSIINNTMKYFIYKTTHINGKYYIGRHCTDNIDDGYIGSGMWPRSIKDKNTLSREILEYSNDFESLVALEQVYLNVHFGKPNCMNMCSDSIGFDSRNNPMKNPEISQKISGDNHWSRKNPDSSEILRTAQNKLVQNGTHIFVTDGHPNKNGDVSRKTAEMGNNVWQTNNPSIWRSEEGIHHWQNGNSPNFEGKLNKKLVKEGTHNFLGPELNEKRIKEGTHNLLGSSTNKKMLEAGTHPSQRKATCPHCDRTLSIGMIALWHGDKCKMNPNKQ